MIIDRESITDFGAYFTNNGKNIQPQIACLTDLRLEYAAEHFIEQITKGCSRPPYRSKSNTGIVYYLYCSKPLGQAIKAYIDGLGLGYTIAKQNRL